MAAIGLVGATGVAIHLAREEAGAVSEDLTI